MLKFGLFYTLSKIIVAKITFSNYSYSHQKIKTEQVITCELQANQA